jgi:GTP-binding protein HflX
MRERSILVTLDFGMSGRQAGDAASELEELSRAAGLSVIQNLLIKQRRPNAAILMGRGKAEELRDAAKKEEADVIVFDANFSATQQRNLEEIVQVKTIDRAQLILDIFALRARSTEGKLQVELAQLKYLLPRLSGKGIYLSRLGGGVGTRGPGEQKLEVDRRRLRQRIFRLEREFKELKRRRAQSIERKKEKELPLISLAGYTNAGKSTLFNRLTNAEVLVKDQLFSTLDTTTRLLPLPGNQKALLVDTVGFVRRLPHHLVEAFKATLEETVHADLVLHVIDASRPDAEEIQAVVTEVLKNLGAKMDRVRVIWNKIDLIGSADQPFREGRGVSALTGQGLEDLKIFLSEELGQTHSVLTYFVPKERLGLSDYLYHQTEVLERKDEAEGSLFQVKTSPYMHRIIEGKLNK